MNLLCCVGSVFLFFRLDLIYLSYLCRLDLFGLFSCLNVNCPVALDGAHRFIINIINFYKRFSSFVFSEFFFFRIL